MTSHPYIAKEPEPTTGFLDAGGRFHGERYQALRANFMRDLDAVVADCFTNSDNGFTEALEQIAAEFPDMLRILIGDRDYT